MKPDKLVVKVRCECGNVITIRTTSDQPRVGVKCWYSEHVLFFVMRGFMKAQGYCFKTSEAVEDARQVDAWVDYQGQG